MEYLGILGTSFGLLIGMAEIRATTDILTGVKNRRTYARSAEPSSTARFSGSAAMSSW